jgi:hypothetical protein
MRTRKVPYQPWPAGTWKACCAKCKVTIGESDAFWTRWMLCIPCMEILDASEIARWLAIIERDYGRVWLGRVK